MMNLSSLEASITEATASSREVPLRVVFYNGHLKFFRSPPDERHHDFRTFSYDKLAPYSALIADAFQQHGETPRYLDQDTKVEHPGTGISLEINPTMENRIWRMTFFWELGREKYMPGFDEPFRELLAMLERTNDALKDLTAEFDLIALPEIDGVTKDVSILKLARMYWAAKHLLLQAPLRWDHELRAKLVQRINNIDTHNSNPAFRGVDFWYIWGAFRNLDNEIVDAMVAKLSDAQSRHTDPEELKLLVVENVELAEWISMLRERKSKMTWAQHFGGGSMHGRRNKTPSQLPFSSYSHEKFWGARTATESTMNIKGSEKVVNGEQHVATSAPITNLRKDTEETHGGESEVETNQGQAYTTPTEIVLPTTNGSMQGKKKSYTNKRWRDSY